MTSRPTKSSFVRAALTSVVALAAVGCLAPPSATTAPETPRAPAGHVRVAGVVLKWLKGDPRGNLDRLVPLVEAAAQAGADVICTTEGALDGYAITVPGTAAHLRQHAVEVPDGPLLSELRALARRLRVVLVVGLLERDWDATYNAAVVLGPDGEHLATYRKRELGFEATRNTPGSGPVVVDAGGFSFGLLICADRKHPELAAPYPELGADFLLCPSGGEYGYRNDRDVAARSRETGLGIVFVHPVEFLVTDGTGARRARALLGNRLSIEPSERDTTLDSAGVFFYDVPVGSRTH